MEERSREEYRREEKSVRSLFISGGDELALDKWASRCIEEEMG